MERFIPIPALNGQGLLPSLGGAHRSTLGKGFLLPGEGGFLVFPKEIAEQPSQWRIEKI